MDSFAIAFHHATPHGVLTAVHIPDSPEPAPQAILDRMPPAEAEHAQTLRGYRQVQYVGGRIALRAACAQLGVRTGAILSTERGAPVMPQGFTGSVSHKRTIAIGMAARSREGTLGVDIEDYAPARPAVAKKVLRPEELEQVDKLAEDRRWIDIVLRFSIKESVYKALDPYVNRYVGFQEAAVMPDLHGHASVQLFLTGREGPFAVDARYQWLGGRILTSVRIVRDDG